MEAKEEGEKGDDDEDVSVWLKVWCYVSISLLEVSANSERERGRKMERNKE